LGYLTKNSACRSPVIAPLVADVEHHAVALRSNRGARCVQVAIFVIAPSHGMVKGNGGGPTAWVKTGSGDIRVH